MNQQQVSTSYQSIICRYGGAIWLALVALGWSTQFRAGEWARMIREEVTT